MEVVLKNRLSKLIVLLLYEGVEMDTIKHSCKRDAKFKLICKTLKQYQELHNYTSNDSIQYSVIFILLDDLLSKLNF